jgi:hypothetical protein
MNLGFGMESGSAFRIFVVVQSLGTYSWLELGLLSLKLPHEVIRREAITAKATFFIDIL